MRLELVFATLSFGATSLFWLAAALRMEAALYGSVMQLQALLMIWSALFSLRTYDLVFHLEKHHGWPLDHAWRSTLRLEAGLLVAGASVCAVFLHWPAMRPQAMMTGGNSPAIWLLLPLLANLPVLQGASAALLRGLHRDRDLAVVDVASSIAWAGALCGAFFNSQSTPLHLLSFAFAAGAVRGLVLVVLAIRAATPQQQTLVLDRKRIGKFLLSGQFTNLLKNNLVPIETLLLGRVAGVEAVALFRVARSLLSFSSVLLNVAVQRAFREISRAGDMIARRTAVRRLTKVSLVLFLLTLPVSFLAAWAFVAWRGDTHYDALPLVLFWCAVATLPAVLQQGQYAALSLDGGFTQISIGYGIGLAMLVTACLIFRVMTVWEFLLVVTLAGVVRCAFMWWADRHRNPELPQ